MRYEVHTTAPHSSTARLAMAYYRLRDPRCDRQEAQRTPRQPVNPQRVAYDNVLLLGKYGTARHVVGDGAAPRVCRRDFENGLVHRSRFLAVQGFFLIKSLSGDVQTTTE
ncbi:uncharacterized protein PG986_001207 [Apiospora aurea]|uniref:Uncharacterized protein n=1 Tax=Apiospora aurea TaxID=335848 RepID=A0ABR1QXX2_9PEZI